MTLAKLPEGWGYTGKTFHRNLEEDGVVNHFYWNHEMKSIYQITNLRKTKGGEIPGIIEFSGDIVADVRFVNLKNPKKTKRIDTKYFTGSNTYYDSAHIFYDKEIKPQ